MQSPVEKILGIVEGNSEKLDSVLGEQAAFTSLMRDQVLPALLTVNEALSQIADALADEEGGQMQEALDRIAAACGRIEEKIVHLPAHVATALNGG